MKAKKPVLRAVSLTLCVCMLAALFSGCGGNTDIEATASAVSYDDEGKFATTLSLTNMEFTEGITADSIAVSARQIDREAFKRDKGKEPEKDETGDYNVDEKYIRSASLRPDSIEYLDAKNIAVTFADDAYDAALQCPYAVIAQKDGVASGKDLEAYASTSYLQPVVLCETKSMYCNSETLEARLQIVGGSFADEVTAEQVTLSGSLQNMRTESVKTENGGLVLAFSGKPTRDKAVRAYPTGTITLDQSAVTGAETAFAFSVDILVPSAAVQATGLRAEGGSLLLPVEVQGTEWSENLSAQSVVLGGDAGLKVESVARESETKALVRFGAGTEELNKAAEMISACTMELAADATRFGEALPVSAALPQAGLEIIFDYVEQADADTLSLQLKLLPSNGTLQVSSAEEFLLGGDFAQAKSVSLADNLLTVVLPANGSAEDFSYHGSVTAPAGKLLNRWGTPTDQDAVCDRVYAPANLGKGVGDVLTTVKGYYDKYSDKISTIGSGVGTAVSLAKTVGGYLGWFETTDSRIAKLSEQMAEMSESLKELRQDFNAFAQQYKDDQDITKVQDFDKLLSTMTTFCTGFTEDMAGNVRKIVYAGLLANGQGDKIKGVATASAFSAKELTRLQEEAAAIGIPDSLADVIAEEHTKNAEKSPDVEKLLSDDNAGMTDDIKEKLIAFALDETTANYDNTNQKLVDNYVQFCGALVGKVGASGTDYNNSPIKHYQNYLCKKYNWETQTHLEQMAYWLSISNAVDLGYRITYFLAKQSNPFSNNAAQQLDGPYETAANFMNDTNVKLDTSEKDKIYCYTLNCYMKMELHTVTDDFLLKNANVQYPLWRDLEKKYWAGKSVDDANSKLNILLTRLNGKTLRENLEDAGFKNLEEKDILSGSMQSIADCSTGRKIRGSMMTTGPYKLSTTFGDGILLDDAKPKKAGHYSLCQVKNMRTLDKTHTPVMFEIVN